MKRFLKLTRAIPNPSAGLHDELELVDGGPVYLRARSVELIEADEQDTALVTIDVGNGAVEQTHVMESAETVHDAIVRAIKELENRTPVLDGLEDAWDDARTETHDKTAADLVVVIEAMVEQLGEALSEEPSALRGIAMSLAGHAARLAELAAGQDESSEGKAR